MKDGKKLSERVRECAVDHEWNKSLADMTGSRSVPESLRRIADGIAGLEGSKEALESDKAELEGENARLREEKAKAELQAERLTKENSGFSSRRQEDRSVTYRLSERVKELEADRSQLLEERDDLRDAKLKLERELAELKKTHSGGLRVKTVTLPCKPHGMTFTLLALDEGRE